MTVSLSEGGEEEKPPPSPSSYYLQEEGEIFCLTSLVEFVCRTDEGRRSPLQAGLEWWPLLVLLHCTAQHCRLRVANRLIENGAGDLM